MEMNINILAVGKIKQNYIQMGIDEFTKRLRRYTGINVIEISDEKIPNKLSETQVKQLKEKEGKQIINKLPQNTYVIALDERGKQKTSIGLAESIQNLQVQGNSNITFIIGGALGLGQNVIKRADKVLSLSQMTFTHQMIRLILLEQIYRAFKIMRGEPYHK